jgi:GTP cyclohydrolase I
MPEMSFSEDPGLHTGDLHDIARYERPAVGGRLDRAGMTEIEMPIRVRNSSGLPVLTPARVDAFVSLDDPDARGIHMSRFFLLLQETLEKEVLELPVLETLLRGFLLSHDSISQSAYVDLRFQHLVRRPALLSNHEGWPGYPVRVSASVEEDRFACEIEVRVTYSSTCPCSAALSRQHIQRAFDERFGHCAAVSPREVAMWLGSRSGIGATPHSQPSYADVRIEVGPAGGPSFEELIDIVETVLETPVQAAVKRVDEQEFARLNGENPMFCEDAARRIQYALQNDARIHRYHVRVEHQESLHPHNAVSSVSGDALESRSS